MNGFLKNITTGRDNQTHDIVRVIMLAVALTMLAGFGTGLAVYDYGYFYSLRHPDAKPFDIQTYFNAMSMGSVAITTFLMGTCASLFFKKTTEPDGSSQTVERMTEGQPKETIKMTQVNNIDPEVMGVPND